MVILLISLAFKIHFSKSQIHTKSFIFKDIQITQKERLIKLLNESEV